MLFHRRPVCGRNWRVGDERDARGRAERRLRLETSALGEVGSEPFGIEDGQMVDDRSALPEQPSSVGRRHAV
jgi:hypothetical protein